MTDLLDPYGPHCQPTMNSGWGYWNANKDKMVETWSEQAQEL